MASSIMKLPRDMMSLIAEHVTDPRDFVNSRAVCRDWKSVFTSENYSLLNHVWKSAFKDQIPRGEMPWLMLAEREDTDVRSFFCPSTLEAYDILFPELWHKKIAGSAYGWLVRMDEDKEIDLFNPLTGEQRKLPPQHEIDLCNPLIREQRKLKLPPPHPFRLDIGDWSESDIRDKFLVKVILTSSPSKEDCMAIALFSRDALAAIFTLDTLGAVARPGDEVWTTLGGVMDWRMFQDFINYKGNIYTIDCEGWFGMLDLGAVPKAIRLGPLVSLSGDEGIRNNWDQDKKYLVEVSGDLLVIVRLYCSVYYSLYDVVKFLGPGVLYRTLFFKVYKLNQLEPEVEWVELKDLGDYSVFVGQNTSFAYKASRGSSCRRNCIYFTDDYFDFVCEGNLCSKGHDQGIYSLEDGSIQVYYEDVSSSYHSPPIWFTPSLL